MECPKCGFVNYPEAAYCARCGALLGAAHAAGRDPALTGSPDSSAHDAASHPDAPGDPPEERAAPPGAPPRPAIDEIPLIRDSFSPAHEGAWRGELADRVARFRRRRAGLPTFDSSRSLEFDFEAPEAAGPPAEDPPAADEEIETAPHEPPEAFTAADRPGHDWDASPGERPAWSGPPRRLRPVEIVFQASGPRDAEEEASRPATRVAPPGARFTAGIADAAVLLAAGGMFAFIFWIAGGRWSRQPSTLAVTALLLGMLVFGYFALFTALVSATPGQRALGLEVRNFDEARPSTRESLWRAFGYLVSAAALGLGFVWALVDSDGLTWHDRISETCLVERRGARDASAG